MTDKQRMKLGELQDIAMNHPSVKEQQRAYDKIRRIDGRVLYPTPWKLLREWYLRNKVMPGAGGTF